MKKEKEKEKIKGGRERERKGERKEQMGKITFKKGINKRIRKRRTN